MLRALAVLLALSACRPEREYRAGLGHTSEVPASEPARERRAEQPAAVARPRPAVLPDAMRLFELPVAGFEPAVIAVPEHDASVPIVVATHGAGGDPEWQCQHWAEVVAGRALVLCPRGKRISLRANYGHYYPNHLELERELESSIAALRARYGSRLQRGNGIYTGFSQGATMGALMIVDRGHEFPFVLLIEGATREFSLARARRFRQSGGRSVAFVCGGRHCAQGADNMVTLLRRAGLEASADYVVRGGHTDDGAVGMRASEIFERMLEQALALR